MKRRKKNLFKSIFVEIEWICVHFESISLPCTQFIFHISFPHDSSVFSDFDCHRTLSWRCSAKRFHIFVVIFHYWVFNIAPWFLCSFFLWFRFSSASAAAAHHDHSSSFHSAECQFLLLPSFPHHLHPLSHSLFEDCTTNRANRHRAQS